jgi:DNA-binding transcriptional ArsR family regulator
MNRYSDKPTITTLAQDGSLRSAECEVSIVDPDAVRRAVSGLASSARVARTTAIFSSLADPTRFRILDALAREELCVCDLAEVAGISQSGASHQLRLLRDRGLVAYRRDGQRAVYRLADDHVWMLIAAGLEHADEDRA